MVSLSRMYWRTGSMWRKPCPHCPIQEAVSQTTCSQLVVMSVSIWQGAVSHQEPLWEFTSGSWWLGCRVKSHRMIIEWEKMVLGSRGRCCEDFFANVLLVLWGARWNAFRKKRECHRANYIKVEQPNGCQGLHKSMSYIWCLSLTRLSYYTTDLPCLISLLNRPSQKFLTSWIWMIAFWWR